MKIKAHHVKMARAAWRRGFRAHSSCSFEVSLAVLSWHRAAKGKHQ